MTDVGNDVTPPKPRSSGQLSSPDVMSKPPLPSPLPSMAAHNTPLLKTARTGNLHVQLPANNFALPTANPFGSVTPSSVQSPSDSHTQQPPQTPGGSITAPSPVKKKMSLGDYLGRRGTMTTPTTEKTQNSTLAPPSKPVPHLQSTTPPLSTDGEPPNLSSNNNESRNETDVTMKDVSKPPISPPYVPSLGMPDDKVSPTT